jgi:hypothetical protein
VSAPAVPLARRVMKARRPGRCSQCSATIRVGEQIACAPGRGWSHVGHVIDRITGRPPANVTERNPR